MNHTERENGVTEYFFPPREASAGGGFAASPLTPFPRWPLGRALGRLLRRPRVDSAAALVTLDLPASASLKLRDAAGFKVLCASGRVWVTQTNDALDVELRAGESLTLSSLGVTLAMAMAASKVQLQPPLDGQAASPRLLSMRRPAPWAAET